MLATPRCWRHHSISTRIWHSNWTFNKNLPQNYCEKPARSYLFGPTSLLSLNSADVQEPCNWRLPHRRTQVSSFIELTHLAHWAFREGRAVPYELGVLTTHSLPFFRLDKAIAGDEAPLKELHPAVASAGRKAQAQKASGAAQVLVQTAGKDLHRAIARASGRQGASAAMGNGSSTGSCPAHVLGTTSWRRAAPWSFAANRLRPISSKVSPYPIYLLMPHTAYPIRTQSPPSRTCSRLLPLRSY